MKQFLPYFGEGLAYILMAIAVVILFRGCALVEAYTDRIKAETKSLQSKP